jgi:hypothetical protein
LLFSNLPDAKAPRSRKTLPAQKFSSAIFQALSVARYVPSVPVRKTIQGVMEERMDGKDLQYETRIPDVDSLSSSNGPLRLHSWFDFQRNVMVVEVAADPSVAPPADSSNEPSPSQE